MLSCDYESEDELKAYVQSHGGVFVPCPNDLNKDMHGMSGLLLAAIGSAEEDAVGEGSVGNVEELLAQSLDTETGADEEGEESQSTDSSSDDEGDEQSQHQHHHHHNKGDQSARPKRVLISKDETVLNDLRQRLIDLQEQRAQASATHADLERKCIEIFHKENEARLGRRLSTTGNDGSVDAQSVLTADMIAEREELHHQITASIKDKLEKIHSQHAGYDRLALDLQLRLDDKQVKLKQVMEAYSKLTQ